MLAVHDDGVFELEANAVTLNDCTNPPTNNSPAGCEPRNPQSQVGGEDWDLVFAETDSADATSFVTDMTVSVNARGRGDSILSQTPRTSTISGWDWKQTTTTSVQDKADIEHAYAAQYVVDKTGEQCGSVAGTAECELLYFGADRFSNSGDTVMGFWFFRTNVTAVGPNASGNGTFDGSHTARSAAGSRATSSSSAISGRAARRRRFRSTSGSPRAAAPPQIWI